MRHGISVQRNLSFLIYSRSNLLHSSPMKKQHLNVTLDKFYFLFSYSFSGFFWCMVVCRIYAFRFPLYPLAPFEDGIWSSYARCQKRMRSPYPWGNSRISAHLCLGTAGWSAAWTEEQLCLYQPFGTSCWRTTSNWSRRIEHVPEVFTHADSDHPKVYSSPPPISEPLCPRVRTGRKVRCRPGRASPCPQPHLPSLSFCQWCICIPSPGGHGAHINMEIFLGSYQCLGK